MGSNDVGGLLVVIVPLVVVVVVLVGGRVDAMCCGVVLKLTLVVPGIVVSVATALRLLTFSSLDACPKCTSNAGAFSKRTV